MRSRRIRQRRSGFTLLEVSVAMVLVIMLGGIMMSVIGMSLRATNDTVMRSDIINSMRLILNRLADLIAASGDGHVWRDRDGLAALEAYSQSANSKSDGVLGLQIIDDFDPVTGVTTWSGTYVIALEASPSATGESDIGNNLDDDGDGLIDEGAVMLYRPDGGVELLGLNVTTLSFERSNATIAITLLTEGMTDYDPDVPESEQVYQIDQAVRASFRASPNN